jgi:hypothetical protein
LLKAAAGSSFIDAHKKLFRDMYDKDEAKSSSELGVRLAARVG